MAVVALAIRLLETRFLPVNLSLHILLIIEPECVVIMSLSTLQKLGSQLLTISNASLNLWWIWYLDW
jgi:hypothetical protein